MTTRATIRTWARIRADQDNSTFPTDTQYNYFIDQAGKEVWYDLLRAGWPMDHEEWTITLDGSAYYALGSERTMAYGYIEEIAGTNEQLGIRWIDDGSDPTLKNTYEILSANHVGAPKVTITNDGNDLIIDYSNNASPGPTYQDVANALNATGYVETFGTDWAAKFATAWPPGVEPHGYFRGGVDSEAPVAVTTGAMYVNGSTRYELPRLNEGDRATLEGSTGRLQAYDIVSHTAGMRVRFFPPAATGTAIVRVIREWAGFTSDFNRWVGPARSDELIALKAAARGCRKENNDQAADRLEQEYLVLLDKVQQMASWVNMRHPASIRNENALAMPRDPFDYEV